MGETTAKKGESLPGSAGVLFVGSCFEAAANFAIGVILVRYFTDKAVFATYSQAMLLVQSLILFAPLGIHRSIVYFFPRVESPRAFALQTASMVLVLLGMTAATLIAFRTAIGVSFNNSALSAVIPIAAVTITVRAFESILNNVFIGTGRTSSLGVFRCVWSLVYFATVVGSVLGHVSVKELLIAIFVSHAAKALFTVLVILRLPGRLKAFRNFSHLPRQLRYSLPLGFGSFTGVIAKTIDRFIVVAIFPPAIYAIYDRGATQVPFVSQIPYSIGAAIQSRLTLLFKEGHVRDFLELWHKAIGKCAFFMFPTTVFCELAARYIIVLINTESYKDSTGPFQIYLLLLPLQLTILPSILMAIGRTHFVLWLSTGTMFANVAFSIFFVKVVHLGQLGPAVGTVVARSLNLLAYLWIIGRLLDTPFFRIYPWRKLTRVLGCAVLAGAAAVPAFSVSENLFILLAVSGFAYGCAYILLGFALRVIRPADFLRMARLS